MTARRLSPRALSAVLGVGALVGASSAASAQGVWFDIGIDREAFVYDDAGGPSFEHFPGFPFGEGWPPGTLVFADLAATTCDAMPGSCDPTAFVAGYLAFFDDAGCGCGGYLVNPCTLRLYYDGSVVSNLGASEAALVFARWAWDFFPTQWVAVAGATVDTNGNFVEADVIGSINANQYYGLFTALPPPPPDELLQDATWGRIKALWD